VVGGAAVVTNGLVVCVTPVVVPARRYIYVNVYYRRVPTCTKKCPLKGLGYID